MDNVRDLLFNKETLDSLLDKWGASDYSFMIPWSNGFALTDQVGNITDYLNIDSNGQLLFQNHDFSTIGSVSSVSDSQFQVYDHHDLLGSLFTSPDAFTGVSAFYDMAHDGTSEILSNVLDIDVDSVHSLLNIHDILNFF